MKKIVFALMIIGCTLPLTTRASHFAGAEIWYEYTGNGTNHKYRVWLHFYRDVSGITAPANPSLCITSTCSQFSSFNATFTFAPFSVQNPCGPTSPETDTCLGSKPGSILTPGLTLCADGNSGGVLVQTEIHRYYADITLPGACSSWIFSFSENARNANDNLVNAGTFYTEAVLNNSIGNDNSPEFRSPAIRAFCMNTPTIWKHKAIDKDGDSLYYSLAEALTGTCPNPSFLGYKGAYSKTQPIQTTSGILMDHSNGTLLFTPSSTQVVVVKVKVESYRYDNALALWMANGYSTRDVQIPIIGTCSVSATTWGLDARPDTLLQLFCGDTSIGLKTTKPYFTNTLAGDATDFAIINSKGVLLPLVKATVIDPNNDGESTELKLNFHQALSYNDTLMLYMRTGSDGNRLVNVCGIESTPDTVMYYVDDCVDTSNNSALGETALTEFSLFPNPATTQLTLSFANASSQRTVQVFDNRGQLVFSAEAAWRESKLNIAHLPPGLYLVRSTEPTATETRRFLKTH